MRCSTSSKNSAATGSTAILLLLTWSKFPGFYWNTVSGHLEEGMKYLSLTASGRQWIANLHNHIFNHEHFNWQMGPQI